MPLSSARTAREMKPQRPVAQVLWLAFLYWPAAAIAGAFLVFSLLSFPSKDDDYRSQVFTLLFGSVSCILGALMATGASRGRISNVEFHRGTTTVRVIAFVWVAALGLVVGAAFVGAAWGGRGAQFGGQAGELIDTQLSAVIGIGSLLGVVGPGFTEYREARAKRTWPSRDTAKDGRL